MNSSDDPTMDSASPRPQDESGPSRHSREVTVLLDAIHEGDANATDRLLMLVYDELRALAQSRMRNEPAGHTLQPTALVHEAYMRLIGDGNAKWENRGHFFGAAALAMRRILVERARRYKQPKHGGGRKRLDIDQIDKTADHASDTDLIALDEVLKKLEEHDPRMAQIVMLRFFAGLSVEDTAAAMDISPRTVKREWAVAKAWLFQQMTGVEEGEA